ncbi:hypothetical protein Stsp01_15480 [Streptomyces sp. NBRC 13847]|nr:hypothetical protein Stsp01_15480 [Streptomyces sp. NBRC 13847]
MPSGAAPPPGLPHDRRTHRTRHRRGAASGLRHAPQQARRRRHTAPTPDRTTPATGPRITPFRTKVKYAEMHRSRACR